MKNEDFKDWIVLTDEEGAKHPEGWPIAQMLCRSLEDAKEAIKKYDLKKPVMRPYKPGEK